MADRKMRWETPLPKPLDAPAPASSVPEPDPVDDELPPDVARTLADVATPLVPAEESTST